MHLNDNKRIQAKGHESRPRDRVIYRAYKKYANNRIAKQLRRDNKEG